MKKNYFILILGFCLIFTACKKEELVRLDADVEDFAGQKAYIGELDGGKYTCFEAGDVINVNGSPITITAGDIKRDGRGVTLNVSPESAYNAVFPSSLVTSLPYNATTNISVTLPRTQAYETVGNRQKINIPMCGRLGSSNGSIHFHNLCALLKIVITNDLSEALYYDSIVISCSDRPLSGSGKINDIASEIPEIVMDNPTSSTPVSLTFSSRQTLAVNGSATYFVVVPKAENASGFKVSLVGKPGSTRDSKYCYERTKSGSCSFSRNVVQKIPFSSPTKREDVKSYFSVGSNKYVRFSPGNLRWSSSGTHRTADGTTNKKGTWSFAPNQWDRCSNEDNKNISENSSLVDCFGWGTSGYRTNPWYRNRYNAGYANGRNNLTGTLDDWGEYNDINNPVNGITESYGTWRSFSKDEFEYLMTRQDRSGAAKVNGVEGIIILPDNWVLPTGVPTFTPMTICTNRSKSGYNQYVMGAYTNNSYTAEEWRIMENHGAIFLPKASYRYDDNYNTKFDQCYYTSTFSDADYVFLTQIDFSGQNRRARPRCDGMAVRLVKDYTPGQ